MRKFVSIFSGLALILFLVAMGWNLKDSSLLRVERVNVVQKGEVLHPILFESIAEDINSFLSDYSQQPIWKVSIENIRKALAEDSRIEDFQVKRKFPNQVIVALRPKQPLAALLSKKGRLHPLSADGSLLPDFALGEAPDLPIVRGLHLFKNKKARLSLVGILNQIPEQGIFSREKISEVMQSSSGEVSVMLVTGGTKVLLGKSLDEKKITRVGQVLKYLQSRSFKGRVIDARFSKKVVVRVRNAS